MRGFFWKFVLCLAPCVLAAWVTTDAVLKFQRGDSGGFKFGVDLVGGTILVYEIDLRKQQADGDNKFDPVKDINVLAESLKRRIDPNDLYNIIIRPAGGEGRVEIILPTGGTHRTRQADKNWSDLLTDLKERFKIEKLEVGRGKILEVADRIQLSQAKSIWEKKLFGAANAGGWKRLIDNTFKYWPELDDPKRPETKVIRSEADKLPVGDLEKYSNFVIDSIRKLPPPKDPDELAPEPPSDTTMQVWINKQAWEEMMRLAREKFKLVPSPALQAQVEEEMQRIPPDSATQLTSYILSGGSVIAQAGMSMLAPFFTENAAGGEKAKEVERFIEENYGPSARGILDRINEFMDKKGRSKDLSVEEVQRIKELVSKVGSLEFSILANEQDDKDAITDIKDFVNKETETKVLQKLAKDGLPPPVRLDAEKQPLRYKLNLARAAKSTVTYRWVELGPQERRSLNLDNAARNEAGRSSAWLKAKEYRDKAVQLPQLGGFTASEKYLLQGALFFSRICEDRNLPDEERRKKEIEYFVLVRDPEFDPNNEKIRTPKIDGNYLVNAYNAPGADLRPTVHFAFNNAGGELFGQLTRKNVSEGSGPEGTQKRRHLAIILDGQVMSAPTINSEIRNQGQITGNFTQKEVDGLVNILRAGRLPATLKPQPVSESTIGATLGEDTIRAGVYAILLAFAAVLVFMCVYYRFAGFVASVALLANLLLTIGFMVGVQATFTLSGLAGIVLMLGMAVDANVLIYERMREERERGCSLAQAIRNGYDHALPTIIDTHLSSIFTAIVLYVVGNDNLKGFGVSLTVGLVISLFTSLYMTRAIFDFFLVKGWFTRFEPMKLFAKPSIDFMSIRHQMFVGTLVVALLGAALFIGRLPNDLNIDFVGGTAYGGQLKEGISTVEMRKLLDEKKQQELLAGAEVEPVEGSEGRRYTVKYKGDVAPRTVALANIPDGTSVEQVALVKKRVTQLPDPSVELLYPSSSGDDNIAKEMAEGRSRHFVLRTSEKEAQIVQTVLDRLLRTGEKELMKKVYMVADPVKNRETRLRFYTEAVPANADPDKIADEKKATASQSFLKSLLTREMRREFGLDDKTPLPFSFDVSGEGNNDESGKFKTLKLTLGVELKESQIPKVDKAIQATVLEFAARPQPDRLENFDSQLAAETRYRAMWAILASWAAILVYLWFRFGNWTFGLAAVICLVHDLFLTLGAIAACYFVHGTFFGNALMLDDFKIDLPAVAALLTLVGYSVNDTIVVFDRIREVRGKNPDLTSKMINDSVNQTLSRTVLASLTTWLVVVVLYIFGGPGVHLFAFVMVVGVIVGTYSSIYIASPLLLMFGEGKHEDSRPLETKPQPAGAKA